MLSVVIVKEKEQTREVYILPLQKGGGALRSGCRIPFCKAEHTIPNHVVRTIAPLAKSPDSGHLVVQSVDIPRECNTAKIGFASSVPQVKVNSIFLSHGGATQPLGPSKTGRATWHSNAGRGR